MSTSWLTVDFDTPLGFVAIAALAGAIGWFISGACFPVDLSRVVDWARKYISLPLHRLDERLAWPATRIFLDAGNKEIAWARFAAAYSAIVALAVVAIPALSLLGLLLGYVGVVSIWRMWDLDEQRRTRILKKQEEGGADESPDLRGFAVLAALLLLVLFPLMFWRLHEDLGCFETSDGERFHNWVLLSFDSAWKSVLDWSRLYETYQNNVRCASFLDHSLIFVKRLTIGLIVVQGVYRAFQIRHAIQETVAVAVATNDYQGLELVGRRCVPELLTRDPGKVEEHQQRYLAKLGDFADVRALPHLIQALYAQIGESLASAIDSLGKIANGRGGRDRGCTIDALLDVLRNAERSEVLEAAIKALKLGGDERAVDGLLDLLGRDGRQLVRKYTVEALGNIGDTDTIGPLLHEFKTHDDNRGQVAESVLAICLRHGDVNGVVEHFSRIWSDGSLPDDMRVDAVRHVASLDFPCVKEVLAQIAGSPDLPDNVRHIARASLDLRG